MYPKTSGTTINQTRLRENLVEMVNIYSPSGKEAEIVQFLFDYLTKHGLKPIRQQIEPNRENLLIIPDNAKAELVLVGHVDTVASHDYDHFGCELKDNRIIGLGAADMKGGCAAMIEAVLVLHELYQENLPVALALVVGEEESGDGSFHFADAYHYPWAVIGEPTDLKPCLSHFGYIELILHMNGRRMHASLAQRHNNPLEALLRLSLEMIRFFEEKHPETIFNLRDLLSSQSGFAVPEWGQVSIDVHIPPGATVGVVMAEIEEILVEARATMGARLELKYRFPTVDSGYLLPDKGHIVEQLKKVFSARQLPFDLQSFPSHSDANLIWQKGTRPILIGPGRLIEAHSPDEYVDFAQVVEAANIYLELGNNLAKYQLDKKMSSESV